MQQAGKGTIRARKGAVQTATLVCGSFHVCTCWPVRVGRSGGQGTWISGDPVPELLFASYKPDMVKAGGPNGFTPK